MRKLIARVFDYSLDGLVATEGTDFFQFCRDLPDDLAEDAIASEFYAGADMHIMGRAAYQSSLHSPRTQLTVSHVLQRARHLHRHQVPSRPPDRRRGLAVVESA
jgi:hypothetical protein